MDKKKHSIGSIIFRVVLIVVAGLTIGLGIFSWNSSSVLGDQLPMPFGVGAAVVLSGSMQPTLKTNDLVVVSQREDYEVGDIVVYQTDNSLVIHRIVDIDGESVTTQGDANNVPDEVITKSQIKGSMLFRLPFLGNIFKFIKSPPGTIMIVAIAVFLLYRSRLKEQESDQRELLEIANEIRELRLRQQSSGQSSPTDDEPSVDEEDDPAQAYGPEPDVDASEPSPEEPATDGSPETPSPGISAADRISVDMLNEVEDIDNVLAFKKAVEAHEADSAEIKEILTSNSEHSVPSDGSQSSTDKS